MERLGWQRAGRGNSGERRWAPMGGAYDAHDAHDAFSPYDPTRASCDFRPSGDNHTGSQLSECDERCGRQIRQQPDQARGNRDGLFCPLHI
jgi:hypothetical protein